MTGQEIQNLIQVEPLEMNVSLTIEQDKPTIELRKRTYDDYLLKMIVAAAMNEQVLLIRPKVNNKLNAINSLIEKGVCHWHEHKNGEKQLMFTI